MAIIKPFKAVRPANEYVKMVAELPYDVMNREEAKKLAKGNKYSYLHIDRAEIDLDDKVDEHDEAVYLKARENLDNFRNNDILVNESPTTKNFVLSEKDIVSVNIPKPKEIDILPENIPINIVYEDDDLLIVNKEKGIVVHPAPGNYTGTLVNALLYKCKDSLSGINGNIRPGIVHRIDKYTSGLLIIAKNDISHNFLAEQIKEHSFTREYEAIVYGNIKEDSGTIRINIARHKTDRKKMAVTDIGGKLAVTHFTVLKRYGNFTHLRLNLETGRTH